MTDKRMVGKQAPRFEMDAVFPNGEFGKVSLEENLLNEKWTILFFYRLDFTSVCLTEITSFSDRYEDFNSLDALIIGASTDSIYSHQAWINTPRDKKGLGHLKYPLAADLNHIVSKDYGVLLEDEGTALRGLFIICPEGKIMYHTVHHNQVGRDVDEILRVLQALQTGSPCPANWKPGQKTM